MCFRPKSTSASSVRRFSSLRRRARSTRLAKIDRPQPDEAAAYKLTVALAASPNPDVQPDSHQARVPADCVPVPTLGVARERVRAFIAEHHLGSENFTGQAGLVCRDGVPLIRIDYNLRFVELEEKDAERVQVAPGGAR